MVLLPWETSPQSYNYSGCVCVCTQLLSHVWLSSNSMNCSPPGFPVHRFSRQTYWSRLPRSPTGDLPDPGTEPISPATLELAGGFFTTEPPEVKSLSCVWLFATPWTIAYQAPLSVEVSRQEYWSGLPFPSPGDLPDPGIELESPAL